MYNKQTETRPYWPSQEEIDTGFSIGDVQQVICPVRDDGEGYDN